MIYLFYLLFKLFLTITNYYRNIRYSNHYWNSHNIQYKQ